MSTLPTRTISAYITEDLKKKMVFLGGPRQVGKTTLAQSLIPNFKEGHKAYLNWDSKPHRDNILKRNWPKKEKLIVLDEIHKSKSWQIMVKGLFDTLKDSHSFLVTGSARLNHFRKGGDSLLGRYHYYRLHPYSLPEIGLTPKNLNHLFHYGGFPETLLAKDERTLRRWHKNRIEKLVRIDLRDLSQVSDIDKVELLAETLPTKVGSPLSIKSLSEDLEIDPKTTKRWIELLETLYYCFQISPYGAPKIRAVKKEKKCYLWDWSQIENPGLRFENMVACQLLKFCHFHEDVHGHKMELRYIRDTDKREVDFVVLKNKTPLFAVECKLKEKNLSPSLFYFKERTTIPKFYQIHMEATESQATSEVILTSFLNFCSYESMV
jgi:predicted AAA+ superfamily ATPase